MSLGLLFPGQGSQHVGMGRELAAAHDVARRTFEEADEILGFSLSTVAWEGPGEELTLTKNAQPAILVHSVAACRAARGALGSATFAAGHSLGEFSAHVAAGTLPFPDALEAVRLRGELMFRAGQERPGTMAAVLALADEAVEEVCREASTPSEVCVPANFNSEGQVVISGDRAAVRRATEAARERGARRAIELDVSGAFHSPLMAPAEEGLRESLEELDFSDPELAVISNVTAEPVERGDDARELLIRQLTSPVRWAASIRRMIEGGVERFVELGPGTVLCGLCRRNARELPCASAGTPEELEKLGTGVA